MQCLGEEKRREISNVFYFLVQKLESSLRKIESEPEALRDQYSGQRELAEDVLTHGADLKFVNMTGQTFINNAKVNNFAVNFCSDRLQRRVIFLFD